MSTQTEARIFQLYKSALLLSKKDRPAFLREACGKDLDLLSGVEKRLRAAEQVQRNMQSIANVLPPGTQLGPYTIESTLGAGGMGTIFLAHQKEPVERQVALKFMAWHMDESSKIRFLAECQHLASLSHSHIGKFYDIESTSKGETFLVLEYLKGQTLDHYLQGHLLPLKGRLEIFLQICRGVSHAHLRGIIHRDLKPSNIMIIEEDGSPKAKVIDFGIARSIHGDLDLTTNGQPLGSYFYMSPEQAGLFHPSNEPHDIDIRTDVYSLGAILYELLTQVRAHNWPSDANFFQIMDVIREGEIPQPSQRLKISGTPGKPATISSKDLKGDLDWIVLKALEKDRTNRYESVSELGKDILRYLNDIPVAAGPKSFLYQVRKFGKRHIIGISSALFIFLAVILGFIGTSIGFIRANKEARKSERVAQFLENVFYSSDPYRANEVVTANELLENGIEKLNSLDAEPEIQAHLMQVLGGVLTNMGSYEKSGQLLNRALVLQTEIYGSDHKEVGESLNRLGILNFYTDNLDAAEEFYKKALKIRRKKLGKRSLEVAHTLNDLGLVYKKRGNHKSAEPMYLEALDIRRQKLDPAHGDIGESLNNLAALYRMRGDYKQAEPLFKEAISVWGQSFGEDHPKVAIGLNGLAGLCRRTNRFEEAEQYYREALAIREKSLGDEHPDTATSQNNLGLLLKQRGQLEEAAACLTKAIEIWGKNPESHRISLGAAQNNLGLVLHERGSLFLAENAFRMAIGNWEAALGKDHQYLGSGFSNYATLLKDMGEFDQAIYFYQEALRIALKFNGENDLSVATARNNLGMAYMCNGSLMIAENEFEKALLIRNDLLGSSNLAVAQTLNSLGTVSGKLKKAEIATAYFSKALTIKEASLQPGHPGIGNTLHEYAYFLFEKADFIEAESNICRALKIFENTYPENHWKILSCLNLLGALLSKTGSPEAGEAILVNNYSIMTNTEEFLDSELAFCVQQISEMYAQMGAPELAMNFQ